MKTTIGNATILYSREGKATHSFFVPAIHTIPCDVIEAQLLTTTPKTGEQAKEQAQRVLADWFSKVEDIELADRETGEITSTIVSCEKWDNDIPKSCTIEFVFVTK